MYTLESSYLMPKREHARPVSILKSCYSHEDEPCRSRRLSAHGLTEPFRSESPAQPGATPQHLFVRAVLSGGKGRAIAGQ